MGLDMFVNATRNQLDGAVDFPHPEECREIFYWRKHPNLHGWMHRLYKEKGGKMEDFNTVPVVLKAEDLDRLEAAVLNDALPVTTGFFFGRSDPDRAKGDIEFIMIARQAIEDGENIYYQAWY